MLTARFHSAGPAFVDYVFSISAAMDFGIGLADPGAFE
jgi:hypothetical protein